MNFFWLWFVGLNFWKIKDGICTFFYSVPHRVSHRVFAFCETQTAFREQWSHYVREKKTCSFQKIEISLHRYGKPWKVNHFLARDWVLQRGTITFAKLRRLQFAIFICTRLDYLARITIWKSCTNHGGTT